MGLTLAAWALTATRSGPTTTVAAGPLPPRATGRTGAVTTTIPTAPASAAVTAAPDPTVPTAPRADGCGLWLAGQGPPRPVGHCTVIEIGDSLGADLGWGLARHLAPGSGIRLVQLDRADTGLSNPWYFDWPAHLASDLSQYHPDLVVVSLGGNDEQGMEVDGSAVPFPAPAWQRAYLSRVRQVISEATAGGAYVLWVGMPVMEQPSYSSGMRILNYLYQEGAVSDPGATFVPTWSLFSRSPGGEFSSDAMVNGSPATLRQPDGIHYSFSGEDVLATYMIGQLASIYDVSLEPTAPAVITG